MSASVDRPGLCEDCGAPRVAGQRYCLSCGARIGLRDPQLEGLLRRMRASGGGPHGAADTVVPTPAGPAPARWDAALRLPSAKVSAALVLMFLGFGVIVGGVAGTPLQDTLAASSRGPLRVVLPASAPAPAGASKSGSSSSGESEPPAAESEPTPGGEGSSSPASSAGAGGSASGSSGSSSPASAGNGKKGGASGGEGTSSSPSQPPVSGGGSGAAKLPPVKHVFVIVLSDQPYAAAFGPESKATYLSRTLERRGELLVRYYAVAHQGLADGIALLSGQGPTPQTVQNCPVYENLEPGTTGAAEQVIGHGCVYPSTTGSLPGQLMAKGLSWRAYVQGMDEGPAGAGGGASEGACGHPPIGAADPTSSPSPSSIGQAYATWRNPFVYFRSLTGSSACAGDDVGLDRLASDLSGAKSTPSFAYIVPDRCHDGSPGPCPGGAPGGLAAADSFLEQVVPKVLASRAYKEDGLLAITIDQAPSSGEFADSSSCCGQPQFPNLPPSTSGLGPEGGGQVGALLLSPFVKGGGVSQEPYSHFSLLRTVEDLFGLPHLGYAGLSKVKSLESSLFISK